MPPSEYFTAVEVANDAEQRLIVSDEDARTLYFITGYVVAIFILWNFPILKHLLYPFKLIVTALHEFGHAIVGKCTGAKIEAIEVDADTGGVTKMRGGNQWLSLPAGYLGSSFFGGLMVFAGFDMLGSKIVSAIIGVCMLITLYWAKNWIARVISILYIGLIALFWWLEDGLVLPYIVLFIGVMCSLQSLWDLQGLIFFKHEQSDATKFAELCGCCPAQVWGFIWMILGLLFMSGAALAGVMVF
eukprot:Partr_v1_DN28990_c1_g1_i1_m25611 putative NA